MVYIEPECYFNKVLNWDSFLRATFITVCENNVFRMSKKRLQTGIHLQYAL